LNSGRWVPAWIGVGSNLDEPVDRVRGALQRLSDLPETRCTIVSALYANPPMGGMPQPDYINAVVGVLTRLSPRRLLEVLQGLELEAGRDRASEPRWGPRRLDLDILCYGLRRIDEPGLTVPHPGISDRNFVLFPLLDVAPGLLIPGIGPLDRLAARSDRSKLSVLR
jgi:2-amino-4-hydroxy-6-hydroxymethyldihydropteridine diphosphokinase